jgi:hypothetical protein
MSFGSKSSTAQSQSTPSYGSLSLQSSTQGVVVPVVYGTMRLTGNLIWYGDFVAVPHSSGRSGGGGKGGSPSGGGGSTSYTYQAAFAFGVAAGPVLDVAQIWWDQSIYCQTTVPGNATFMNGAQTAQWSYLEGSHPDQSLVYHDLAYMGLYNVALGDSADTPNIAYEVLGMGPAAAVVPITGLSYTLNDASLSTPWVSQPTALAAVLKQLPSGQGNIAFDTSPAFCFYDLLTNPTYGAGFPAAMVGDLTAYATWCQALGLTMSVALTDATDARSVLADWLSNTQAEAVWSSGILNVVPRGDQPVTGTAVDGSALTYTPNVSPVMSIDDSLMLLPSQGGAPLTVTRKDPSDAKNRISLEYSDRSNDYNLGIVTSEDMAHIATYGLRQDSQTTAHYFTSAAVAQIASDLLRNRSTNVLANYEWRMGALAALLEPMDVVALTDLTQGLNLQSVRIIEIEEEEDTIFRIQAEDLPGDIGQANIRPVQVSLGFASNYSIAPGNVNPPVMFEPPLVLCGTEGLQLWLAVSGGSNWGGCDVWVAVDGGVYAKVGTVNAPARHGVLSAAMAAGDTVLSANLSACRGQLSPASPADAAAYNSLCWVDGELVTYQGATAEANGIFALDTLSRGLFSTSATAHAAGTSFARLDGAIFKYPILSSQVGQSIHIKFTSFNTFGGSAQTLDEVVDYPFSIVGTAYMAALPSVTGLATVYQGGISQLTWAPVSDPRPNVDYEIRQGASWGSGQFVGRTTVCQFSTYGDGTYWVAAHFRLPDGSADLYSPVPASLTVAGSQLLSNVVASWNEAATGWTGSGAVPADLAAGLVALPTAVQGSPVPLGLVNGAMELEGSGNVLTVSSILALSDLIAYGGVGPVGAYTIPAAHVINIGRPASCNVLISTAFHGQAVNANFLTQSNIFNLADVTSFLLSSQLVVIPQILLSPDGVTWPTPWQSWTPGAYTAQAFNCRVLLCSTNPQIMGVLSGLTFAVDVPDRVDQFTALAVPAAGMNIAFSQGLQGNPAAPFLGCATPGGPPNIQVTLVNGQAGDDVILSNQSTTGFSIQIVNGSAGVARTVNIIAQGY